MRKGDLVDCGGIVLCGGRSTRMRWPKAALPFGPETMLQRVVRLLRPAVARIVVVADPAQQLPELPADTIITSDRRQGRGPLEAIHAGLSALPTDLDAAYVTGCDVPLLVPAFVTRMTELLGDCDIAVPLVEGHLEPLAAVYRRSVIRSAESLLAADRLSPLSLFGMHCTRLVSADELAGVDSDLATLHNINLPSDYLAALAQAGLSASPEVLAKLSAS